MEDRFLETINYRGLSVPVYERENVQYTIIAGKEFVIGKSNYRQTIERLISRQLDVFADLDPDSWLEWFDNGNYRDIRLIDHDRIIKIFLVHDPNKLNYDKLILEAKKSLKTYREKM